MSTKSKLVTLLLAGLALSAQGAPQAGESSPDSLTIADFSMDLQGWDSKRFKGDTDYRRLSAGMGNWVLRAVSEGAASSLLKRVDIEPRSLPILRWKWKVSELPLNGDEALPDGDDSAARVLLVFRDGALPWQLKSVCYLWANTIPRGRSADNVFSSRVKLLAVRSGSEEIRMWKTEERNYVADYRQLFGKDPGRLVGVAIMTDTDNTGSRAVAYYDFIELRSSESGRRG